VAVAVRATSAPSACCDGWQAATHLFRRRSGGAEIRKASRPFFPPPRRNGSGPGHGGGDGLLSTHAVPRGSQFHTNREAYRGSSEGGPGGPPRSSTCERALRASPPIVLCVWREPPPGRDSAARSLAARASIAACRARGARRRRGSERAAPRSNQSFAHHRVRRGVWWHPRLTATAKGGRV